MIYRIISTFLPLLLSLAQVRGIVEFLVGFLPERDRIKEWEGSMVGEMCVTKWSEVKSSEG